MTKTTPEIRARLEALCKEIQSECISYGEIAELQSLRQHIDPDDVELLQWAGVPEFDLERAALRAKKRAENDVYAMTLPEICEKLVAWLYRIRSEAETLVIEHSEDGFNLTDVQAVLEKLKGNQPWADAEDDKEYARDLQQIHNDQ